MACGIVTADPASGSFFPIGTTTVHVSSSTGDTSPLLVTVTDNENPVITSCPVVPRSVLIQRQLYNTCYCQQRTTAVPFHTAMKLLELLQDQEIQVMQAEALILVQALLHGQ